MKKRWVAFSIMFLIFASFMLGIASADLEEDMSSVLEIIFGDASPRILLAKLLLSIIVLAIIWTVLNGIDFFNKQPWALWIVSIAVALLATRFLESSLIETILLPYSTLGVVISAGLPFVIFALLVTVGMKNTVPTVRRIAWVLFAVVFVALWFARQSEMGGLGYVYLIFAIAALIMIKLDGTIGRWRDKIDVEKNLGDLDYVKYNKNLKEREEIERALSTAVTEGNTAAAERMKKSLKNIENVLEKLRGKAHVKMKK
jgi:hypothetical protein